VSSKEPPARPRTAARISGIVASLVVVLVMIGTVLIVLPSGTPGRAAVTQIATPYFGQNWRVFAPRITKGNRVLEMRAQWRDENGDLVKSGWVGITAMEQLTGLGNPFPSNIRKSTLNLTNTYLKRYNQLDSAQRERARTTFIEVAGDGFRAIPDAQLIAELGEDDGDVIRYLRIDYMFMRNMTLYATAGFGRDIERVQWRIVTSRPNGFAHRFDDDDYAQYGTSTVTLGWRQSNVRIDDHVVENYRNVIERFDSERMFEEAARVAE